MIEKLNTTIEEIPLRGERFLANKINEIIDTLNKLTKEEKSTYCNCDHFKDMKHAGWFCPIHGNKGKGNMAALDLIDKE